MCVRKRRREPNMHEKKGRQPNVDEKVETTEHVWEKRRELKVCEKKEGDNLKVWEKEGDNRTCVRKKWRQLNVCGMWEKRGGNWMCVRKKRGDNRMCGKKEVGNRTCNYLSITWWSIIPWYLQTLLRHKIALNHSFPTVLLSLNLVQPLWSYNQIITWYLHGTQSLINHIMVHYTMVPPDFIYYTIK